MGKIIRIRLSESDHEKIAGIARATGKGISTLAKEILLNGVKQELKDTQLLNRLIQKIENLSEPQSQIQPMQQLQSEILLQQIKHNTVAVIECLLALSSEFFFDRKKHENFVASVKQILQKIEE